MYGVAPGDPNLVILLQHRAVLFDLLGVLLSAAACRPELRVVAQVARVVVVDIVAVGLLLVAAGIEWRVQASSVRLTP